MYNNYNPKLREYASRHRKQSASIAEKRLWKELLSRNKTGVKFKRQRPIDRYIVDFFSAEVNLIIEIDGSSHIIKGENDKRREERLSSLGYKIIRFKEGEILNNINDVKVKLAHVIHCLK